MAQVYTTWLRPKKSGLTYKNQKIKVEGEIPSPWPWWSKYAIYIDRVLWDAEYTIHEGNKLPTL